MSKKPASRGFESFEPGIKEGGTLKFVKSRCCDLTDTTERHIHAVRAAASSWGFFFFFRLFFMSALNAVLCSFSQERWEKRANDLSTSSEKHQQRDDEAETQGQSSALEGGPGGLH